MRHLDLRRRGVPAWCGLVLLVCVVQAEPVRAGQRADGMSAPRANALCSRTLDRARVDALSWALGASPAERTSLQILYDRHHFALLWRGVDATTGPQVQDALLLLQSAAAHGLRSADYLLGPLAGGGSPQPTAGAVLDAEFDVALSLGMLRYMQHLHLGRIDPRRLGLRITTWDEPHDFAEVLGGALTANLLGQATSSVAPPFPLYGQLVEALGRYRLLATRSVPPFGPVGTPLHPGDENPEVYALGMRLALEGDLADADVPAPSARRYDGALVDGVRRFQERHGLAPDGIVGSRTLAALRVPLAARVRQIELALERLRWLPDLGKRRVIVVNIPMFRLWAWNERPLGSPPAVSMDVIVGRALRMQTPVFVERLPHVTFRPYWNVPRSILRTELLPAMRKDSGYLASHQFEIVSGESDAAQPVTADADTLEREAGRLRLRQRPGHANALGLVKFLFPNKEGVYMHGTPAPELFRRDRRDFSHGCIRVADPAGLAAWVLSRTPDWTPGRVGAAMTTGRISQTVKLAEPIDVVLFYLTAVARPDGTMHFAEDIYGHDAALERALAGRQAAY